ncbi:MAG: hypothetical protein V4577_00190 [Bacteroidota bacterium]
MKIIVFAGLLIMVTGLSCKPAVKRDVSGLWERLLIISEHDVQIHISNDNDTSVVNVYHSGSFFQPLPKNAKVKIDTLKVFFSKVEKDTIFSLVQDLITNPAHSKNFCTEFIGSLDLRVSYGEQFIQSAKYSSVCDWNTLSDKTKRLHDILRSRIKNVYLGEKAQSSL